MAYSHTLIEASATRVEIGEAIHLIVKTLADNGTPVDTSMVLAQRIMEAFITKGFTVLKR